MRFLPRAVVAAALFAPAIAAAQVESIAGDWYGTVKAGGQQLPVVFHIKPDGAATLDSPAQSAMGLTATATLVDGKVKVALQAIPAAFEGAVSADGASLVGKWGQNGGGAPLTMTRTAPAAAPAPNRPQTPKPPFDYRSEEVAYVNRASGLKLAGTLTLPQGTGPYPVALLITGSGTQDRDETIEGHKPFLLIADALTRRGVAVLRVDDRAAGGSQAGDLSHVTTADFVTDVEAGVAFLRGRKDIDPARIGLIGHSEGGVIAPIVAAKDPKIAFLVMLAGTGVPGEQVLNRQARDLALGAGAPPAAAQKNADLLAAANAVAREEPDPAKARARIVELFTKAGAPAQAAAGQADFLTTPWYRYFIMLDPAPALHQVRCPVLALNGDKDANVSAAVNLPAIKAALVQSPDVTTTALPGLNHIFQTVGSHRPTDYGAIEETMAPSALSTIVDWTVAHAAKP
uniref:alpha/beta hydrolase family protein n=1 Tax=uncultured Caulobacter sp. TaxID=158749 RepID=UPI0025EA4C38|nr:alpha/beta hydrolase [uncultured Caulobacter sp.]